MSFPNCMLCGRPLKSNKNKEIGIGSVCARKLGLHLVGKKVLGKTLFDGLRPAREVRPIKRFLSLDRIFGLTRKEKAHGESLCVLNGEFYTASEAKALKCAVGF